MKKLLLLFIINSISFSVIAQEKQKHTKRNQNGILIEEGYYLKNKKTDEWNFYYGNGTICLKSNYKDGILNGKSIRYDLQGNVIAELTYLEGKITGHQIYYYPNGNKLSEGNMINEKEEGAWKYYNINGELMGYVKYKNGIQLNEKSN